MPNVVETPARTAGGIPADRLLSETKKCAAKPGLRTSECLGRCALRWRRCASQTAVAPSAVGWKLDLLVGRMPCMDDDEEPWKV